MRARENRTSRCLHAILSSFAMEIRWTEGPKQSRANSVLRDSSGISMVRKEYCVGVQGSHRSIAVVPSASYPGVAFR